MANEEFQKLVIGQVPDQPFQPLSIYDPDEDTIEFLTSNESYRAERIDSLVTVYYGRESKEIIGSLIRGVSKFLKSLGKGSANVRLEIRDDKIKLVHLFKAALAHRSKSKKVTPTAVFVYEKLGQVAQENDLEANVAGLVMSS